MSDLHLVNSEVRLAVHGLADQSLPLVWSVAAACLRDLYRGLLLVERAQRVLESLAPENVTTAAHNAKKWRNEQRVRAFDRCVAELDSLALPVGLPRVVQTLAWHAPCYEWLIEFVRGIETLTNPSVVVPSDIIRLGSPFSWSRNPCLPTAFGAAPSNGSSLGVLPLFLAALPGSCRGVTLGVAILAHRLRYVRSFQWSRSPHRPPWVAQLAHEHPRLLKYAEQLLLPLQESP